MSKKNLDKIFQEKFSEFSDVPTEKVWKSIEASLNKKKKNRMIPPIWWKLGGIAAALAIGIFLFNPFKDDGKENNTIISDADKVEEKQYKEENAIDQTPMTNMPQVVESAVSDKNPTTDLDSFQKKESDAKSATNTYSKLLGNTTSENSVTVQKWTDPQIDSRNEQDPFVKGNEVIPNGKETAIAVNESQKTEHIPTENHNSVKIENEKSPKNSNVGVDNTEKPITQLNAENSKEKIEDGKKSIFDEITDQKEEEVQVVEVKVSKWSAGPSIAPIYFNAIGQGSPVSSIFVPNSKSGDVSLSYGLAVAYDINKKLSLRTGVHKVDYGYNTNDVEFSSTLAGFGNGQIDNIDYSLASRNIVVESKAINKNSLAASTASDVAAKTASLNGVMAQQFGYLEIPLELNYSIIDNKFGVDLIGGVSSLFLMDNSVTLTSGELVAEMGEANNVNNVNFSTNIGFGVNYKFSPRIQFNVEPVFKYQLNTFSETSGNFQPFTIGVYSGLNFKF